MSGPHPVVAAPAAGSETFSARVDRLAKLYYDQILPRFIDRHYRGRGYGLIAQMLAVHDSGKILEALAAPAPSKKALELAGGAARFCPLSVSGLPYLRNDVPVFGEFRRRDLVEYNHGIGSVRTLSVDCEVVLFEPCFSLVSPERLDDEILFTIFHEYIHYVESYLPAADRPLANREAGIAMPPNDVAAAKRRDRLYVAKLWSIGIGFVAVSAVLGYALTPQSSRRGVVIDDSVLAPVSPTPTPDYEREAAELYTRIALALSAPTAAEVVRTAGRAPVADTTSPLSHGILEWAKLEPLPDAPPLPDYPLFATMCWIKPSADISNPTLFCAMWEEKQAVLFEARIARAR